MPPSFTVTSHDASGSSWRVEPQDETWLPLVTREAVSKDPRSLASVIKEHPQDDGVLLRGSPEELRAGFQAVLSRVKSMKQEGLAVLRSPTYGLAVFLRRLLLTRPRCLAAEQVTFTNHVEDSEFEPMAAHRIGQLVFFCSLDVLPDEGQALLQVPPGSEAMAKHLRLPEGVHLRPGEEETPLGLTASCETPSTTDEGHVLAIVELRASSVFQGGHARHCCVEGVEYYPEVRIRLPFPHKGCKKELQEKGLELSNAGVITSRRFPVRQEFVEQLLPDAVFEPPRYVQLDFVPLHHGTRERTLAKAFDELLLEITAVSDALFSGQQQATEEPPQPHAPSTAAFR